MAALHRDGVREFDFSVGLRLQAPLRRDAAAADRHQRCLELARMPYGLRDHMVRAVRNQPQLDARLRRVFGKPLSHEEN